MAHDIQTTFLMVVWNHSSFSNSSWKSSQAVRGAGKAFLSQKHYTIMVFKTAKMQKTLRTEPFLNLSTRRVHSNTSSFYKKKFVLLYNVQRHRKDVIVWGNPKLGFVILSPKTFNGYLKIRFNIGEDTSPSSTENFNDSLMDLMTLKPFKSNLQVFWNSIFSPFMSSISRGNQERCLPYLRLSYRLSKVV